MPGSDVEFVRAVREELGPSAPLMADANNAYTLDDIDRLAELDALDLMMIEQPLAWDDIVRHAELQRASRRRSASTSRSRRSTARSTCTR